MKFLLVGPNRNRSTDGVIIRGIENIISHIYSDAIFEYLSLEYFDGSDRLLGDLQIQPDVDCIIICGTPWLWDSFQNSKKYKNLTYLLRLYDYCTKTIFMGIGSCLNLKDENTEILRRQDEVGAIQELYSKGLVICRDSLASSILENAKIRHYFLPCPAFFCYVQEYKTQKDKNILIWTDPEQTISSQDWSNPTKLDTFYSLNNDYIALYNPEIYCAFETDIPKALYLGFKPRILKDWTETLDIMTKAQVVLSSRVHCCVPAFIQQAKIGIIPLDTRHYVLSDYGCPIVNNSDQIKTMRSCHINYTKYLEKYKTIIQTYMNSNGNQI